MKGQTEVRMKTFHKVKASKHGGRGKAGKRKRHTDANTLRGRHMANIDKQMIVLQEKEPNSQ